MKHFIKIYILYIIFKTYLIWLDIDECKEGTHNCDRRKGNCTNTIGSFKCHCNEDYEGDGVRCFCKYSQTNL